MKIVLMLFTYILSVMGQVIKATVYQ